MCDRKYVKNINTNDLNFFISKISETFDSTNINKNGLEIIKNILNKLSQSK